MCRLEKSCTSFCIDEVECFGFHKGFVFSTGFTLSGDRQAIIWLLCGRSASNQWVLFIGFSSWQFHYRSYDFICSTGLCLPKLLVGWAFCQCTIEGFPCWCNCFVIIVAVMFFRLLSWSLIQKVNYSINFENSHIIFREQKPWEQFLVAGQRIKYYGSTS